MDRPRIYRTEVLVLKGYDYGEADRILSLYTPQAGIVRAIAKGVRRTKSRKAGHLDLFTRSNLLLARGRQLDVITQAETIETFQGMREDLWRSSQAHYVAELVESFGAEQLANYPVYALTVATLRRLAAADRTGLAVRAFELQLLSMTGYRPQLHRCLHCDALIAPQINRFSPRMGGILCPDCATVDTAATPISVAALKLMRNLQTNENAVLQLTRLDDGVEGEVQRRLQEYIVHRLERLPRSIAVLDKLRAEGAFQ